MEAEVRTRRERSGRYLPKFPPEVLASLNNTPTYPPDGAAGRRAE